MSRLYEMLGVEKDATLKDIKAAYRAKSKKAHPDAGGHEVEFNTLKLAFDILSNPARRERYDRTGRTDESPVTPQAIRGMIANTVRAIVTAQRPDGTTDNPEWDDIKQKVILTILDGRRAVANLRVETQRKIKRVNQLLSRFKSRTEEDPVGDALREELKKLEEEMRGHEDALEMSRELEAAFRQYDYEVGPGSEGQFNPGPPPRRGTIAGVLPSFIR